MRLYSEINLNEQLDRLNLTPKQKDKVRYLIENITYRYSNRIEKMKCCENCEHCGSDNEIGENGDYTDYTCIQCNDLETEENLYPNWELKNE